MKVDEDVLFTKWYPLCSVKLKSLQKIYIQTVLCLELTSIFDLLKLWMHSSCQILLRFTNYKVWQLLYRCWKLSPLPSPGSSPGRLHSTPRPRWRVEARSGSPVWNNGYIIDHCTDQPCNTRSASGNKLLTGNGWPNLLNLINQL